MNALQQKPYFRRSLTIALCAALPLQALLLVPLAFVSEMGNFDFLGYILVCAFSVLNWVFVFWRTVHIGKTTKCAVQGEKLLLSRGFIRKETISVDLSKIDAITVKAHKATQSAYLTYNARTLFLPYIEEDALRQILDYHQSAQAQKSAMKEKITAEKEEAGRATYFINQSAYLIVKRALEAFILAYLLFIAVSAAFYGNVLVVCHGEYFTAFLFALGCGALFPALLFVPGGRKTIVLQNEKICITKTPQNPTAFYAREDLIRASRTVSPLMRLLGACRLDFVFPSGIYTVYLRNKDFYYLDFFFEQSLEAPQTKQKQTELDDAFYVHPHFINALLLGVKTFALLAVASLFLLPVVAGVLHANGITLSSFLPEETFVIRIFVLFIILLAASIAIGGIIALSYLIYLSTINENYRFSAKNDTILISKGKFATTTHLFKASNLRVVKQSYPVFSLLGKNKTLSLCFAEGKRRFITTFGGQAVTDEELAEFHELVPGFTPAPCPKQPFKRFLPTLTVAVICAYAPIVLFSFLMSPMVVVLAAPVTAALIFRFKHYSFGETDTCITLQTGIFTLHCTTICKSAVCAVRVHKALIARAFRVFNAEICLTFTESSLNLAALNKKERDIMANLIKSVKNN